MLRRNDVVFQVSWRTLPGLKGLACSGFRAVEIPPEAVPDALRGVVVELAGEADADALVAGLEARFGDERFLNTAAAFDTVKAFVLEWGSGTKP